MHDPCTDSISGNAEHRYAKSIEAVLTSSAGSDADGRTSTAAEYSTRKTSFDSRFASLAAESLKRRISRRNPWTRSSPEGGALGTIDETKIEIRPSVLTVEKAAAAKIFLETTYHDKMHRADSRENRRQFLEAQLYYNHQLDAEQKTSIRSSYYAQETCHLRESRVLSWQSHSAGNQRSGDKCLENYEALKVLGKGSFGVVRLVREKPLEGQYDHKQVFAMKVIRKSDMLRSSQEGHLRAERDFLVASEGSQ